MSLEVKFSCDLTIHVPVPTHDEALRLIDDYLPTTQPVADPHAFYVFLLQTKKCLIDHFSSPQGGSNKKLANDHLKDLSTATAHAWRKADREYREKYQRMCREPRLKAKLE